MISALKRKTEDAFSIIVAAGITVSMAYIIRKIDF